MTRRGPIADTWFRAASSAHAALLRLSRWRLGAGIVGTPVVLLRTTGRRSGRPREVVLSSPVIDGERVVLVASKGGDDLDPDWYRNLYRHPARQGESPDEAYRMQHDIYSLGVCLLEIDLWESFVDYPSDIPVPGEAFRDLAVMMMQPGGTGLGSNRSTRAAGYEAKRYMEDLARTKLLQTMGERYSHVVLFCLTCLDGDNELFGSDAGQATNDPGGIRLSACFNEIVLEPLNEIVV